MGAPGRPERRTLTRVEGPACADLVFLHLGAGHVQKLKTRVQLRRELRGTARVELN